MKKIFVILVIITLASSLLCGCSDSKEISLENSDTPDMIGLVVSTLNNPFFIELKEGAELAASELDYEFIILDSQNDVDKELSNINTLIEMGVKIILLNPCDSSQSISSVEVANTAGIPVITLDRTVDKGSIVSHIASDNVAGGAMAADFLNDQLSGNGKIIELEGIVGTSAALERSQGFNERLNSYPDLKVVYSQSGSFDRAIGLYVMEDVLKNYSDIQAVFAHNDEMALGAIQAIDASGRSIIVVGFDGILDALVAINEGEMDATIAQQPSQIGNLGVHIADQYLNDKQVDSLYLVDLKLITK